MITVICPLVFITPYLDVVVHFEATKEVTSRQSYHKLDGDIGLAIRLEEFVDDERDLDGSDGSSTANKDMKFAIIDFGEVLLKGHEGPNGQGDNLLLRFGIDCSVNFTGWKADFYRI